MVPPTPSSNPASTIFYLGSNGIIGQTEIGGSGDPIVENDFGTGTARTHWKESVYQNELMIGFIRQSAPLPISKLTLRAFQDLGYTVDLNQADSFTIPTSTASRRMLRGADLQEDHEEDVILGNDLMQLPHYYLVKTLDE